MVTRRHVLKLSGATVLTGLSGCSAPSTPASPTPNSTAVPTAQPSATPSTTSHYTRVYEDTIDSVVLVQADHGQGTGFMYDPTHLVTNAHVTGNTQTTEIRFNEGQWRTGSIVGTDPHSDLAAVAVTDVPASATPLRFIDGPATIGQEVVAIGNPFNLDGTVTTGIVSGIDRSIPAPTGFRIPDAIQTDAAVNPGNSGGPLVALNGRVVAVINSGGGDNIAFGISAALTNRVIPSLIADGQYEHAFIGISFVDVTPDVAEANNMAEPRGLLIVRVIENTPADGVLLPSDDTQIVDGTSIQVGGDVLLAIDGVALMTAEDLGSYLALHTKPGDTVELTILRDGAEELIEFELGSRPS